jgi:hypothetical protein
MPTDDDRTHRSLYDPPADSVTLREADEIEGADGMMEVRMPIASTGAVRNDGDDPLSAAELRGMADQVDTLTRGVFPEHGMSSAVDREQYSQFEKLGYWSDADLEREAAGDDEDLLMATARMPDPETLPAATGDYREALAILKEQALRGIPIASSIAWKEDQDFPGGNDLLEASIVGIGADPRTSTEGGTAMVARAAIDAGADPDAFLASVRRALDREADADTARPFGPPGGDPAQWEDFDACVADVEDWDNIDDPEAFCAWAEQQSASDGDATEHMTDTDDPGDDEAGTDADGEQGGGDAETTERQPDDVTPEDLAAVVAASYEGVDTSDLVDAWDDMGDFTGGVDLDALAGLVATAVDMETDDVSEMFDDLLASGDGDGDEEQGEYEDGEDDEEMDDDEDRGADGDADTERDADAADTQALADEVADLRSELEDTRAKLREGGVDFERADPDDVADELADNGGDADGERDSETDSDTDTDESLREAWLS